MKVGLLIISHDGLGRALYETVIATLGSSPLEVRLLSVSRNADPDALLIEARRLAAEVEHGDGLLVLTDIYGSTPSNIACRLQELPAVRVVAGVNLPMLFRIFNYPALDLDALAEKALSGGRDGVMAACPIPVRKETSP
ncbi:MAG TPA: PTS fructose transporter subunit IIA [Gammaproteobacteria bacterium]